MLERSNFEKIDILLVDDRHENLLALEAVLSCPEYNLIKASSGDRALRYLLNHTPALILMDVQMPHLSGFETASLIKSSERTRGVPIIFLTALNNEAEFMREGYDQGAVDYIYKPLDSHILKSKVAVFADIHRQHARISRLVGVQQATTQALADATDVGDAISKVLKSVCSSLGWDLGLFWKVDKLHNVLRFHTEWHHPGNMMSDFIGASFKMEVFPGIGLPGKAWSEHQAIWVSDVGSHLDFPRYRPGVRENLQTAVALPIFAQDKTLGVLEFYCVWALPEDSALVKIMEAIGNQIGQFLKRTEVIDQIRASEARNAAILETSLDSIIKMDHAGKIVEFNPAAERTFGRHRIDVIGKEMASVIIPERFRDEHRRGLKHYLATGESTVIERRIEVPALRADGTEFPIELAVTRVPTIDPPLFIGFLRDITERKRFEKNSNLLIEASTVLSSSLNYDETFVLLAQLAVKSLGDWCEIHVVEDGTKAPPRSAAVAYHDPASSEKVAELRSKYPWNWDSLSGVPNVIRTGKSELYPDIPDGFLVLHSRCDEHLRLLRDLDMKSGMVVPLTARKRILGTITLISSDPSRRYTRDDLLVAEELARRAAIAIDNAKLYREAQNAIRTRDEFFSIASHEFKTPLTALKMTLQVMQYGISAKDGITLAPEMFAKMLDTSSRQADRLTHLVEDLLDVVKVRIGRLGVRFEELDLSVLVKEVAEQYSEALSKAKCELKLDMQPGVVGLWDRTRIEQIVVNLISNVIKYAPGAPLLIKLASDGDTATLQIQDSGPGIAPDQQEKLFERFERTNTSRNIAGLGLGLFIVKQIVEAHHGAIRVESNPGKGTKFVIELPTKALDATLPGGGGPLPYSNHPSLFSQPKESGA